MKKAALIILIMNFLLASNAFSFTIITDPDVFYAFFEKPTKTIDFSELKDGTPYHRIHEQLKSNDSLPNEQDCLNTHQGDFKGLTVLPGAFSKHWSFKGADLKKAYTFCDTVLWFDQGISTGEYHMTVSISAGESQPFAIYTNKGFMGILPDTPRENLFIFENIHLIYSFETDFSKAAPLSDSTTSFLAQLNLN